jgi:flavin-dependent dehydrogenase
MKNEEIVVIGGGLGGLMAAALLAKNGRSVLLIEKKTYPFHRVCGEYVSNEVLDFLKSENLYPEELNPARINRFRLTSSKGKAAEMELDLGGFGISRYAFDDFLYRKADALGVTFLLNTQVEQVLFDEGEDQFLLELATGEELAAHHVVGAFGKRSKIDKTLSRSFIHKRTNYIGVKYHLKGDFEKNLIALHNYEGGYCGINPIENDRFCLCYLGNKQQLRDFGSIAAMEQNLLHKNPFLKSIFDQGEFLFAKPEVINEISFSKKMPVENHLLMIGDAAGMITPLCGNGMAIALHTGKLAAEALLKNKNRDAIEDHYARNWSRFFKNRLALGRIIQHLFGAPVFSELTVGLLRKAPSLGKQLIKRTHGKKI